ncbi:glycosyltransferase family 2 protein [Winogradskyella sp. A3E31]|uniref:glycosyltransferase family 2 protein n=1 Tax=Winogradskyella sp. A3E31 TaxID=3349637 RepID=UPI00398A89B0
MKNNSRVSVLLPVYNGEKTIKRTLESLLNQTYTNFELLIGIDGTTDRSKEIALGFRDERIKIIEHPNNLGLAQNLNTLVANCNPDTELFAMAEQDDWYVPERLEWQVEVLNDNTDVGLVSGIAEFKSDNNNVLFPGLLVQGQQFSQGKALFKFLYINQLKVVNTCMMWRKKIHEEHDLSFRDTYGNFNVDWNFVLRFSLVSKVHGIPKKMVEMDRHQSRTSVTVDKWKQFSASRQLLKDFKEEFPKVISKTDYKKALKTHRKIELGYKSKFEIVIYSIYYLLYYQDAYFLNYLKNRSFKYLKKS